LDEQLPFLLGPSRRDSVATAIPGDHLPSTRDTEAAATAGAEQHVEMEDAAVAAEVTAAEAKAAAEVMAAKAEVMAAKAEAAAAGAEAVVAEAEAAAVEAETSLAKAEVAVAKAEVAVAEAEAVAAEEEAVAAEEEAVAAEEEAVAAEAEAVAAEATLDAAEAETGAAAAETDVPAASRPRSESNGVPEELDGGGFEPKAANSDSTCEAAPAVASGERGEATAAEAPAAAASVDDAVSGSEATATPDDHEAPGATGGTRRRANSRKKLTTAASVRRTKGKVGAAAARRKSLMYAGNMSALHHTPAQESSSLGALTEGEAETEEGEEEGKTGDAVAPEDGRAGRHEGYMHKLGHVFKTWKRRFFVLEKGTLTYFTNDSCSKKKGEVVLDRTTTVQGGSKGKRQWCVLITPSSA